MFNLGSINVNCAYLELVLFDQLVVELVVEVYFAIPRVYGWSLGITALIVILLGTVAVTPIYNWATLGALGL